MITLILNVILYGFKVFLEIAKQYQLWTADERIIKADRINNYLDSILKAVKSNHETFNEEAFVASIKQEEKIRYIQYQIKILEILRRAGGIAEIQACTHMGLNVRAANHLPEITDILIDLLTTNEKAKLIAKKLSVG